MKNLVFYVEPDWAFGSLHYELFKFLWAYGFNCQLLSWKQAYTKQEIYELDQHIDAWVTTPHGYRYLQYVYETIPPERCIVIVHAPLDINELIHHHGVEDFYKFKGYGVVSEFLKECSIAAGITRIPQVCPLGINFHTYANTPNDSLQSIGFGGSYHERSEFSDSDILSNLAQPKYKKRGYLAKECAELAGLDFKIAQHYHNSFVTMSGFYKAVDCVIIPSAEEGAGLPALEAGAAGKLVIGTPVGHWNQKIGEKGGITVPIPEAEFVKVTVDTLNYYKENPIEYRMKCQEIQEHAKSYDWKFVIHHWINLLNT